MYTDGVGEWLRALTLLTEDWVHFSVHTWWFTIIFNSKCYLGHPMPYSEALWAQDCKWYTYIYTNKTHIKLKK